MPPTVKLAAPAVLSDKVDAEGAVVNAMLVAPDVTLPPVVVIENERLASPATVNESAELTEPGTSVTSPVTEPTPVDETTTVPPRPVVKRPKPSAAVVGWVMVIGETITAVAVPVAVAVLPGAAKAGVAATNAMAEARMILFMRMLPRRPAS